MVEYAEKDEEEGEGEMKVRSVVTKYGFGYGACEIKRYYADARKCREGGVFLGVETAREVLDIYITPTGFIRTVLNKKRKGAK